MMGRLAEQELETQEGAHALGQRLFVTDVLQALLRLGK